MDFKKIFTDKLNILLFICISIVVGTFYYVITTFETYTEITDVQASLFENIFSIMFSVIFLASIVGIISILIIKLTKKK